MKTSLQRWPVRLAGLAVLSLLVTVTGVQAAQAKALQLPTAAQTAQHQSYAPGPYAQLQLPTAAQTAQHQSFVPGPLAQLQLPTAAQTAQHQSFVPRPFAQLQLPTAAQVAQHQGIAAGSVAASTTAQPASSGMSATTVWIASLVVAGALLVGAWAVLRRRRQRGELASFCAQHPEDARCAAA